jgi:hypothetical protein
MLPRPGRSAGEDLVVTLSPVAAAERVATVRVLAGAEVFHFDFCRHAAKGSTARGREVEASREGLRR